MPLYHYTEKEEQNDIEFTFNYIYTDDSFSHDPLFPWQPIPGFQMGGVTAGIGRSISLQAKRNTNCCRMESPGQNPVKIGFFFHLILRSKPGWNCIMEQIVPEAFQKIDWKFYRFFFSRYASNSLFFNSSLLFSFISLKNFFIVLWNNERFLNIFFNV